MLPFDPAALYPKNTGEWTTLKNLKNKDSAYLDSNVIQARKISKKNFNLGKRSTSYYLVNTWYKPLHSHKYRICRYLYMQIETRAF